MENKLAKAVLAVAAATLIVSGLVLWRIGTMGERNADVDPTREMLWHTSLTLADGSTEPWDYKATATVGQSDDNFAVAATASFKAAKRQAQQDAQERRH